eukprot:3691950-Pyramimonas_sp.AAC.1
MAPKEVDSSSSENLVRAEVPTRQSKLKTATLRLKAVPEVETYSDEIAEDEQIYNGGMSFLRQWLATCGPMRVEGGKCEGSGFADIYSKGKHCAKYLGRCLKLDADASRGCNFDLGIKTYIAYIIIKSARVR